jgi:predicted nucleic acid-binding protein
MTILDTTVLVAVLRDKSGALFQKLVTAIGSADIFISRFTELELLQGAKSESEWNNLVGFLKLQDFVDPTGKTWGNAARTYFDLRRRGFTVRGVLDCCIAEVAIEHGTILIHNDRDFETIATVRPQQHRRLELGQP